MTFTDWFSKKYPGVDICQDMVVVIEEYLKRLSEGDNTPQFIWYRPRCCGRSFILKTLGEYMRFCDENRGALVRADRYVSIKCESKDN